MEKREKYENEGGYNMCQAMRELLEDSRQEGISEGIRVLIETCQEFSMSREEILTKVEQKFALEQSAAEEYVMKYYV